MIYLIADNEVIPDAQVLLDQIFSVTGASLIHLFIPMVVHKHPDLDMLVDVTVSDACYDTPWALQKIWDALEEVAS